MKTYLLNYCIPLEVSLWLVRLCMGRRFAALFLSDSVNSGQQPRLSLLLAILTDFWYVQCISSIPEGLFVSYLVVFGITKNFCFSSKWTTRFSVVAKQPWDLTLNKVCTFRYFTNGVLFVYMSSPCTTFITSRVQELDGANYEARKFPIICGRKPALENCWVSDS